MTFNLDKTAQTVTFLVGTNPEPSVVSIDAGINSTHDVLVQNRTLPEMALLYNQMVSFLPATDLKPVKRFSDKIAGFKRIKALREQVLEALRFECEVSGKAEAVASGKVTEVGAEAMSKSLKAAAKKVVDDEPAYLAPADAGADDTVTELKGSITQGAGPTVVGLTGPKIEGAVRVAYRGMKPWAVGKRAHQDDDVITNIVAEPGHKDALLRWHLYTDGATIAQTVEKMVAWMKTQDKYEGRKDNYLRFAALSWINTDAKLDRIEVTSAA
jgi:hypothetical protein